MLELVVPSCILLEKSEVILSFWCRYKMDKQIIENRANRIMTPRIFNYGKLLQLKKEKPTRY